MIIREFIWVVSSPREVCCVSSDGGGVRNFVILLKVPVSKTQACDAPPVLSSRVAFPCPQSPMNQSPTSKAPSFQAPPVESPSSPRPRPQIAPKPRLELRQRRASAGESAASTVGDVKHSGLVAPTSPSTGVPPSKPGATDTVSPTSAMSSTPGLAMLASVIAAASSQRISDRGRLPQSPSSCRWSDSEKTSTGISARPSSASAASRTSQNGDAHSDVGVVSGSQTLRAQRTAASTSTCLGVDKKAQGVDVRCTTSTVAGSTSPSKAPLTGDSPRRSAVPPPVPPKHVHPLRAEKRSPDAADAARPSAVARSLSLNGPSAAATSHSVTSCPGPGDVGALPFANENVGTIRQRGFTGLPAEQASAPAVASVNAGVTTITGNFTAFS